MLTFTMMVGVAGSGKSTLAKCLATSIGAEIISSDVIRGEIYGDENCQRDPGHVFDIMHQRTVAALSQNISVIYDATNLSCKRRMNFLKSIAHIDCNKECMVVITTPEDIEERMKSRDRKVPMEVVHKQLCQFQCPNYYEGWDNIVVEYNSTDEACRFSGIKLFNECDIPHDNPHHTLSIKEHMSEAEENAKNLAFRTRGLNILEEGWNARIHDIGKPRCKTFTDHNGNPTEFAHYRNHQNYGAYYILIFDGTDFYISTEASLDNACIIQWHMEHYLRQGKALEKFYEMIGPKLSRRLHILEEADKAAH